MRKVIQAFLASCMVAISSICVAQTGSLTGNHPHGLISPDYGIVTANDLDQDAKERTSGRYWQCVPIAALKRDYNAFMDEDPMAPSGVETMMCDLEIIVDLPEGRHVYGDRRRHPNSFCRQFERNWHRLTHGEKTVCFNGDEPSNENDSVFGKYRAWVWNKFKTKKGCYSYLGDCGPVR
jgi:hypothetical protein